MIDSLLLKKMYSIVLHYIDILKIDIVFCELNELSAMLSNPFNIVVSGNISGNVHLHGLSMFSSFSIISFYSQKKMDG